MPFWSWSTSASRASCIFPWVCWPSDGFLSPPTPTHQLWDYFCPVTSRIRYSDWPVPSKDRRMLLIWSSCLFNLPRDLSRYLCWDVRGNKANSLDCKISVLQIVALFIYFFLFTNSTAHRTALIQYFFSSLIPEPTQSPLPNSFSTTLWIKYSTGTPLPCTNIYEDDKSLNFCSESFSSKPTSPRWTFLCTCSRSRRIPEGHCHTWAEKGYRFRSDSRLWALFQPQQPIRRSRRRKPGVDFRSLVKSTRQRR